MKVVRGYAHHDGSVGVIATFEVGTDFTSRTPEFKAFSESVLMSLAFWLRDTPPDSLEGERYVEAPWVGEEPWDTVAVALAAASKQFHEPIGLIAIRSLLA